MTTLAASMTPPKRLAGPAGPRGQRGVSIAEFVIISPLALLVVMAVIQLGLMFVAKQIVNEATFVAARAGAVDHANVGTMRGALIKALIPFYQNALTTGDTSRIYQAWVNAQMDLSPIQLPWPLSKLDIVVVNPNADVFTDFGLTDPNTQQQYIPNDNLEYRCHANNPDCPNALGQITGLSIQDANALKIQVTYAYDLKVPLMKTVFKSVMCGVDSGVDAFGRGAGLFTGAASLQDCMQYYQQGRVPIRSYATVQMQSPAYPQS